MENRNKLDELIKSLSSLEPLEEVPSDVSKRFHETLSRLVSEDAAIKPKTRWFSNVNQFALAASFVLVFALGAVITLSSGGNSIDPLGVTKPQPVGSSPSTDVTDDQLQYSAGSNAIPEVSNTPIRISNSSHNYEEIPMDFYKKLGVGISWNSTDELDNELRKCLEKLDLNEATNLVDTGVYQGKAITAIWAPVTRSSWNVYLVDSSCEAFDKKFVQG